MDDEGHSGVSVYRAYPELAKGQLGKWPMTYFIKLGRRDAILSEYENYEARVDPYVPFHLGPHLVQDRCCLGAENRILVGDWVEESESLHDCAREGRAGPAISCLFDRTLLGWHRSATSEASSVAKELAPAFPAAIDAARVARAKQMGSVK